MNSFNPGKECDPITWIMLYTKTIYPIGSSANIANIAKTTDRLRF